MRASRFAPRSSQRLKTPKASTPSAQNALTDSEIAPTRLSGFQQRDFLRLVFFVAREAVAGHDFFDHPVAPVEPGVAGQSDTSGESDWHMRAYRVCDELLAVP